MIVQRVVFDSEKSYNDFMSSKGESEIKNIKLEIKLGMHKKDEEATPVFLVDLLNYKRISFNAENEPKINTPIHGVKTFELF